MSDQFLWLRALMALTAVLALLGVCALAARWWQQKQPQFLRSATERRLKVLETLTIDPRNKLVLVQCDGATQLLLISATQSMVVPISQSVSANREDS